MVAYLPPSERYPLPTSCIETLQAPECEGEVHQAAHASPERLDSRLSIAFAAQEAAQLGDRTHRLAHAGWLLRECSRRTDDEEGPPLVVFQDRGAGQVRLDSRD